MVSSINNYNNNGANKEVKLFEVDIRNLNKQ